MNKASYIRHIITDTHSFLEYLADTGKANISRGYINTFRVPTSMYGLETQVDLPDDDVIDRIANIKTETLTEERTKATCIMLFMSGMRVGAFVTLPIKCVNIKKQKINQDPLCGVEVKCNKTALTNMLRNSKLLEIIAAWDNKVRSFYGPDGLWYPNLRNPYEFAAPGYTAGEYRQTGICQDIKKLLEKNGITYYSPHPFRHAFVRYCKDRCTTLAEAESIANQTMQTVPTMLQYGHMSQSQSDKLFIDLVSRDPNTMSTNISVVKVPEIIKDQMEQIVVGINNISSQTSALKNFDDVSVTLNLLVGKIEQMGTAINIILHFLRKL